MRTFVLAMAFVVMAVAVAHSVAMLGARVLEQLP
jgi:hypothetical protein